MPRIQRPWQHETNRLPVSAHRVRLSAHVLPRVVIPHRKAVPVYRPQIDRLIHLHRDYRIQRNSTQSIHRRTRHHHRSGHVRPRSRREVRRLRRHGIARYVLHSVYRHRHLRVVRHRLVQHQHHILLVVAKEHRLRHQHLASGSAHLHTASIHRQRIDRPAEPHSHLRIYSYIRRSIRRLHQHYLRPRRHHARPRHEPECHSRDSISTLVLYSLEVREEHLIAMSRRQRLPRHETHRLPVRALR